MKQHQTMKITTLVCLVAGIAGIAPALWAAEESMAVSKLLADAKTQSYAVSVDASILESYTRQPNLSWESHAAEITRMKDDINILAKTVTQLNASKAQAAPWQATATDRIIPLMQELAADTTKSIEYLNKNPKKLFMDEYKSYLEENSTMSTQLSGLISHYVDYGNTKNRMDSLSKKIELPGK